MHFLPRIQVCDQIQPGDGAFDVSAALGHHRQIDPQRHRSSGQRDTNGCIAAGRKRPLERCTEIVNARAIFGKPLGHRPRFGFGFGPLKQTQVVFGVTPGDLFALAAFDEFLKRVGANSLWRSVTHHHAADIHRHKRFRDQIGEALDDFRRGDLCARRDGARRLLGEPTGEDRQATQDNAFRLGQQFIAPVECRSQRPVARQSRAPAPGQQLKPVVEMCRNPAHPESVYARGRQLDRQRNSIQPAADIGDDRSIGVGQLEFIKGRRGTLDKQLNGRKAERFGGGEPG